MPAGGKRKGAGRPRKEETKVIRVPVGVLDRVNNVIQIYKDSKESSESKCVVDSSNQAIINKSQSRVRSCSYYPVLTPFELKRLRLWLFEEGFTKSKAGARKMTSSPVKCKRAFLKYVTLYFQKKSALSSSMALVAKRYSADD